VGFIDREMQMTKQRQKFPFPTIFFSFALLFLVIASLVLASKQLIPVAVALFIWLLINALASAYHKIAIGELRVPWVLSVVLALATIFGVVVLIADLVATNGTAIAQKSSLIGAKVELLSKRLASWLGLTKTIDIQTLFQGRQLSAFLSQIASAVGSLASQIGLIFLYVVFLLIDQRFFDLKLKALFPAQDRRNQVRAFCERVSRDVRSYVWIMTLVSGLTAIVSYTIFYYMGLEFAAFWAFLVFILNFIPTIGSVLGTVLPALYGLVQFDGLEQALYLLVLIGGAQAIIGNIIQPRLMGPTLNLSQFVVILSLFVWGAIWGVVGMFLAVPIMVVLMIGLSQFPETRPIAIILSERGRIEEIMD
jgi:predicted PurR-regulated permease PerM